MGATSTTVDGSGAPPWWGVRLAAGPLAMAVLIALPPAGLDGAGPVVLGLMAWMAIWWLTEAVPVSATALLPLVVLPLAPRGAGVSASAAMTEAAAPYANPLIGLFMGGFMLALAMERWGLHRRLALVALGFVGTRPPRMVAGFMALSAVFSMWVSNTATAVMMLPIALSVLRLADERLVDERDRSNLARALLLGIAYACSIGGLGTLVGTPPNLLLAAFLEERTGETIGFARWMLVGVPVVVVMLPVAWWVLCRRIFPVPRTELPGGRALLRSQRTALGPMHVAEWVVLVVFHLTVAAWLTRPWLEELEIAGVRPLAGLTDAGIALAAGLFLLVCPVSRDGRERVLDWPTMTQLPWGILVLFGGGLSLAAAVGTSGVASWMGEQAAVLEGLPGPLVVLAVVAGIVFLTELTSNTATTATLLPVLAVLAPQVGVEPIVMLAPAALAASLAFMMPVATPPNAIVFGAGRVRIPEMARAGLWLNLVGIVVVTGAAYALVSWLLTDPTAPPPPAG